MKSAKRSIGTGKKVVVLCSRYLHIPAEALATIGDTPNDVMMFEKSSLSIASPQVQAQANFATFSNEQDGFAYTMEKLVFSTATSVSN